MHKQNTDRLVAEQLIGRPRGVEIERIYIEFSDIPRERIDGAIQSLRESGVLRLVTGSRVIASEPVLVMEALGLVAI
jgi:hypothetical protein